MYTVTNKEELKLFIMGELGFYKFNRDDYLIEAFSKDYPNMINDILQKGAKEAGIDIDIIIEKAKEIIDFEINGIFPQFVRIAPIRLLKIQNDFSYFIVHSLIIIYKLSYLFNMPFFSNYLNFKEDDLDIILLYFAIMFNDTTAKEVLKKILENKENTVNSVLIKKEKEKLEIRVFNYIQKYTNAKIMPLFETITNNRGRAFSNLANRLLNTFIKYYNY